MTTSGISDGLKIRLPLVHVTNCSGGLASTWHRMTPSRCSGKYCTVGVNLTRAGSKHQPITINLSLTGTWHRLKPVQSVNQTVMVALSKFYH